MLYFLKKLHPEYTLIRIVSVNQQLIIMERKSTNASYSSPRSQVAHQIQCRCDQDRRAFFSRGYHSLVSPVQMRSCWRAQRWLSSAPESSAYTELIDTVIETREYKESLKQIDLDLARTYPDEPYFSRSTGQQVLRRCLIAFSKYDVALGYVQGMNFIMASLLWHASEEDAFWIFIKLMEDFELRDTYLPQLPGLSKHGQILQLLVIDFLPQLHMKFAEYRINCEMFATEWCFTLFASVIPASQMHHFLDCFFDKGWVYFYRFVIVLLQCLENKMLAASDPVEVLLSLKISQKSQNEWHKFLAVLGNMTWDVLNQRAFALEVDENYIKELHMCFNLDTAQFSLKNVK